MTEAILRTAIEAVLGEVPFVPPLTVAYCQAVYDALRKRLPAAVLDVHAPRGSFIVEAREGVAAYRLAIPVA